MRIAPLLIGCLAVAGIVWLAVDGSEAKYQTPTIATSVHRDKHLPPVAKKQTALPIVLSKHSQAVDIPNVSTTDSRIDSEIVKISFEQLAVNPQQYIGKKIAISDVSVGPITSWYDYICNMGSSIGGNEEPCIPRGGPTNPRCEFKVALNSLIDACVPRSKVPYLNGAYWGESGVNVIGVVGPGSTKELIFMRDTLLIQRPENTSETWADEKHR